MYENEASRYCYPGSEVLINIPGFKVQQQLDAFERIITADRLRILALKPLRGRFDLKHLCDIHKFIFKDIYPFAGKLREEDIAKGNFRFAHIRYLKDQTNLLLHQIRQEQYLKGLPFDEFINKLTHYFTELNVLHPFREGNGRTQREFMRCLALECGYSLDWTRVDASTMLAVMIQSTVDNTELSGVLRTLLTKQP